MSAEIAGASSGVRAAWADGSRARCPKGTTWEDATVIAGMWPDPAENEANTKGVRDFDATAPHSEPGGYVNNQNIRS